MSSPVNRDSTNTTFSSDPSVPRVTAPQGRPRPFQKPIEGGASDVFSKRVAAEQHSSPPFNTLAATESEPLLPSVGMQIGQYELIRQLGAGGMGVVFLARDNKLGRRVAIKFLRVKHAELTRRFILEARATARCTHENIVVIHEVGEHAGSPFMVLEYVDGNALSASRSAFPLPMTQAVEIMAGVVRAVAHAHDNGIVHRDLKPENILINQAGTVKVLDFGIAKLFEETSLLGESGAGTVRRGGAGAISPQTTQATGLVGTMGYMSPEQWSCDDEIDHRADIWSLGVILHELLTGKNPLVTLGRDLQYWMHYLDTSLPSLADVEPNLPKELVRVIDTCLCRDRRARYANARDLLRALEPFLPGRYQVERIEQESGPYAGLRAFQEEDAGRFFGRSNELLELRNRLRDCALMAVVGPSGVGKSSFLRAGVVPSLRGSGDPWFISTLRPGRDPMSALVDLCRGLVVSSDSIPPTTEDPDTTMQRRLVAEPGYFGKLLRNHCRRTEQRAFLLVDQFEELYTLNADSNQRASFVAALLGAADDSSSPVRVVLTLRADFLGRVAEDAEFLNVIRSGLFFLGPPSSDGLREALVQPAELAGYRFESKLIVDEMVSFLESSPSGLPLLQFAASQLWEQRDPVRRVLSESSYRGLGGVAGALVAHADRTVARLSSIGGQSLCRNLFTYLVTPERTRAVRTMTELGELVGSPEELGSLVEELVSSRLLVAHTTSTGTGVEIVHESLIANWPTLRGWLDVSQEDRRFVDQLVGAANQWEQNRRASGLVWRGEMVSEMRRFQRRYSGQLPTTASEFIKAVTAQARRQRLARSSLLAFALIVVAGLFAAGSVALVTINRAKLQAERNAESAHRAEQQAQQRLDELLAARQSKKEAEVKTGVLEVKVKETDDELKKKNQALLVALDQAQQQRVLAETAQKRAEANERAAKDATGKAEDAKREYQTLYDRERARAQRLDAQVGKLVEDLH